MKYQYHTVKAIKIKYLLIFVILLIYQSSSFAQNPQWRVFTTSNSPLPSNLVGSIAIDTNNVKWIGTDSGIVKIDGNNWTIYNTNNSPLPTNRAGVNAIDRYNNYWITTAGYGLIKYDGFNHWIIYDTTNSGIPTNNISDVKIDGDNIKWLGTFDKGIAKFDDTIWVNFDTSNSGIPDNWARTIAIEGHIKWIGTFSLFGGMAKYNDSNWVIYNISNSGIPGNTIYDIKIDEWGLKWIGFHFGKGVGKYNSILNSWIVYNTHNSGLPDGYVQCILTQNHIKWFGTAGGGLARFNDTNWIVYDPSNSPIPSYSIRTLELDSLSNLWISTPGGLAVYNENGIIGINNQSENAPVNFVLYQNYPNPFNPVTKIDFALPRISNVKLVVYDVLGREVQVLINSRMNPGYHSYNFTASELPSGVYFYRLVCDGFIDTKKMTLIK